MFRRTPLFAAIAVIVLAIGISALASARSSRGPAGTISKIDGANVTISLPNGGGDITGTVSRRTDVDCDDAHHSGPGPGGDDRDDGDANNRNDGDDGDRNNRDDEDDDRDCATADLKVGAVVKQADLRLRGGTARWKQIELAP